MLLPVLPHARDIGLHMVIARRSAGAGRALYEPVLAAVRDGDAAGLQLSTGADEGAGLAADEHGCCRPDEVFWSRAPVDSRSSKQPGAEHDSCRGVRGGSGVRADAQ